MRQAGETTGNIYILIYFRYRVLSQAIGSRADPKNWGCEKAVVATHQPLSIFLESLENSLLKSLFQSSQTYRKNAIMSPPRLIGKSLNLAITATAGSGFLLFGYDQGVMSGLLTGLAFTNTFPSIDTTNGGNGSSSLQGTVVAIYEIGCFFGAILCLLFGEYLGRRKSIMLGCVILSIGAAIQASAYGVAQLIVGRIVAGLGNGMNTSTIRESIQTKLFKWPEII